MSDLEKQFTQAMRDLYQRSIKEIKYRPQRVLEWTDTYGGVEAARRTLNAGGSDGISEGLIRLFEARRLDLSVEALMLKPEYRELFTEEELIKARKFLAELNGYVAPWDKVDNSSANAQPTLDETEKKSEDDSKVSYWWVNQGKSFDRERSNSYLWAPHDGLSHHQSVSKLRLGDVIFHYSEQALKAVSKVTLTSNNEVGFRPDASGDEVNQKGFYAKSTYDSLTPVISREQIPLDWRLEENRIVSSPFNKNGDLKQEYLTPLSDNFVQKLVTRFPDRNWPDYLKEKFPVISKLNVVPQLTDEERPVVRKYFENRFSFDELNILAFNLGIDRDSLRQDTKTEFIIELLNHSQRREKLVGLLKMALAAQHDTEIEQIVHRLSGLPNTIYQIPYTKVRNQLEKMLIDRSSFVRDRLESFVGREKELTEIRELIMKREKIGGYITITGQAGQGKSSIIAKLVESYGIDQVTHHFIPFNPGPDYQVSLLRDIIAGLIIKHNLSDIYVASESRQALRDFFFNMLKEIAGSGKQEIIFIDGLDQIEHDQSGIRDLSFLPEQPPVGILFVLGTRPDDALRSLELLNSNQEYKLPNLSRDDFDLILRHRQVQIDPILTSHFYAAMQESVLYLDLVAKELAQTDLLNAEELITTLSHNPNNIFTYSINRLKKLKTEWQEVIKPILGLLLVAQEPFRKTNLQKIIGVDEEKIRGGLWRLGGLLAEDGEGRYYLYHFKFRDYLQQDVTNSRKDYVFDTEGEKAFHQKLIDWCEQGGLELIWQDKKRDVAEQARREYARKHYITHLYQLGNYEKLWEVLYAREYSATKLKYPPNMGSDEFEEFRKRGQEFFALSNLKEMSDWAKKAFFVVCYRTLFSNERTVVV